MNENISQLIKEKSIIGLPIPSGTYDSGAFFCEAFGTFFVTYAYMSCHFQKKISPYLAPSIASVYYICCLTFGEVCGGSFNPARSIAPALIAGHLKSA